jgi:Leucine-rich repeat (LRR) protein
MSWSNISHASTCQVRNANIQLKTVNLTSLANSTSLTRISFISQTVNYLPKGIENFTPDLKALQIYDCQLMSIEKADLKPFPKLIELLLHNNLLEILESDLFESNPQLQYINFNGNKLMLVGENLLAPLKKLNYAYFQDCRCINVYNYDRNSVMTQLKQSCPSPEKVKKRLCSKDIEVLESKIVLLEQEVESHKSENMFLKVYLDTSYKSCDGNLNAALKNLFKSSKQLDSCIAVNKEFISKTPESQNLTMIVRQAPGSDDSKFNAFSLIVSNHNTELVSVEDEKGLVPNFKSLNIYKQQTLFLPLNIASILPNLEELIVASSGLYEITPSTFKDLQKLLVLNMPLNKLQEIPIDSFKDLENLLELDLSFNKFDSLPPGAFNGLNNLQKLNVNGNFLATINFEVVEKLTSLKVLLMRENQLKFISANLLEPLDKLEQLDFTNNVCINKSHPSETIKLIESTIIDNCIAPIEMMCNDESPDQTCNAQGLAVSYPKTKVLKLVGLKEEKSAEHITTLIVSGQSIKFLPFELAKALPKLEKIVVDKSNLSSLQKGDFKDLIELKHIEIRFNNLSSISEEVFDDVKQIEHLYLPNNNIQSLPPKIFLQLVHLKSLILSNNQIAKFTADLMPRKNAIEVFMADNNELELIETKILRFLRKARIIDLSGNVCIDLKYERAESSSKALVELSGEIDLNCSSDD